MKPEPDAVADLVRSLAASPWPATDVQRREWAERFGLPVDGELVEDPGLGPGHHTLVGPPTRDWPATAWHLQRGLFVGVSWFLWHDEEQDAARRAAETLRAALADAWDAAGELRDPVHGSTAVSGAGTVQIDLSHHAPRTRPREVPSRVHLQVDHVERAAQVEAEARMAAEIEPLLERHWDPSACTTIPGSRRRRTSTTSTPPGSPTAWPVRAWTPTRRGRRSAPSWSAPAPGWDCRRTSRSTTR